MVGHDLARTRQRRGDGPPGEGGLMAWDTAAREMVLVTPTRTPQVVTRGSGAAVAGRGGRRPSPPTPIAAEMAFDPASNWPALRQRVASADGSRDTTWRFDGRGWQRLPATPPAPRPAWRWTRRAAGCSSAAMRQQDTSAQLWRWSGAGWSVVPAISADHSRGSRSDRSDRRQFLMFGFDVPTHRRRLPPVRVWAWNGPAGAACWKRLD